MKQYRVSSGRSVRKPHSYTIPAAAVVLAFTILSVKITGFDLRVIAQRGYQFFVILASMLPPALSYLPNVWSPLFDTIKMSLLGSLIGSVLAVPFAAAASANIISNRIATTAVRLFLSLARTLPTLVTALIATYVFGLGTLAGTTAIAIFTFAYVGKTLYEQIETVNMGAFEAMESLGCGKVQAFRQAILPQVLPSYLSVCLFCFEGNVRYASILGYVGAGGLGVILNENIGWRQYDNVGMILLMLFAAVVVIESVSHFLRSKLV